MAKQTFVTKFCFALGIVFTLFIILTPDDLFLRKQSFVREIQKTDTVDSSAHHFVSIQDSDSVVGVGDNEVAKVSDQNESENDIISTPEEGDDDNIPSQTMEDVEYTEPPEEISDTTQTSIEHEEPSQSEYDHGDIMEETVSSSSDITEEDGSEDAIDSSISTPTEHQTESPQESLSETNGDGTETPEEADLEGTLDDFVHVGPHHPHHTPTPSPCSDSSVYG